MVPLRCCVSKTLHMLSGFVVAWRKVGVGKDTHLFCLHYGLFLGDCRIV